MDRRGTARFGTAFVLALLTALGALVAPIAPSASVHASTVTRVAPSDTVPDAPPITVSEFFPEEENLSDCLGLVERPGCGSKARGGWGQTAVFGLLVVGLGLIIWRISRGVKANRSVPPPTSTT